MLFHFDLMKLLSKYYIMFYAYVVLGMPNGRFIKDVTCDISVEVFAANHCFLQYNIIHGDGFL